MADIYEIADRFRARLLTHETQATREVAAAYLVAFRRIQPEIDHLTRSIKLARASGGIVDASWLVARRDRLQALEQQIATEMARFTPQAASITARAQKQFVEEGSNDGRALVRAAGVHTAVGTALNSRAVESIVGFASDGSPLANLFRALGPSAAQRVKASLMTGVTLGYSPEKLAATMKDAFSGDMARALTIARTESLRAYREASRLTYVENQDVLDGWIWRSARSARTCALCWAMDGSIHSADETLSSHPNCRCVMIPLVKGAHTSRETGAHAFEELSDKDQEQVLGQAKFKAYREGKIKLSDLVGEHRDERWGLVRYEQSLDDALGGAQLASDGSGRRPPRSSGGGKPALGRFATVAEAESYARSLGVKEVDFADRLHIAHMTIETLDEMKAKGYPMPTAIKTSYRLLRASMTPEEARGTVASYGADSDSIIINPNHRYWGREGRNAAQVVARAFKQGILSTKHPRHVIRHEFGHMLHAKRDKAHYDSLFGASLSAEAIAEMGKEVSSYGLTEPGELIAEMVAGMMDGKTYSEAAMKWYNFYGGPQL